MCGDHMLKAHAKAYKIYQDHYFQQFRGRVGIVLEAVGTYYRKGGSLSLNDRAMEYYVSQIKFIQSTLITCPKLKIAWLDGPSTTKQQR